MKNHVAHAVKTLELDKILERLAAQTTLADAAEQACALEPQNEIGRVREQLQNTADAYQFLARYSAPSFGAVKNVTSALRRAEASAVLSIPELLDVAELLRVIRGMRSWRADCISVEESSLDSLFEALVPHKAEEDAIVFAIRSPEELNDNASFALADLRRKIASKSAKIREHLERIVRGPQAKYLQETLVTQRDGRFVVPVKAEYRSQVPGIVHDTSATGSTVFIEPMSVVQTNNEIRVLKLREEEEVERILFELSAKAGEIADSVIWSYDALVTLNLIFAKAKLGYAMKAVLPRINQDGHLFLKRARHPLLDPKQAVPITVELGREYDALMITGPNTGGKTVTLKTMGLLTLMTMCGLMIPADDGSEIAVFETIFADIGDEQSIEQSLSTFSSHMVNIVAITEQANSDSLVLFDELCAGTDPVEGAALAKAVLMRLMAVGAKLAVTTHYPELKAYALDTPRVENACCEFDVETLRPTYRLIVGMPGRSNAFAISERLGLDKQIIRAATEQVSEEDSRFERVVASLETARKTAETESEKVAQLRRQLSEANRKAEEKEKEWDARRQKMMEQTRQNAEAILEKTRIRSARLLEELETLKKQMSAENAARTAEKARAAYKKTLNELEQSADPVLERAVRGKAVVSLEKGDIVLITDIGQEATVLEVKAGEKRAQVMSGALKMWIPYEKLRFQKHAPKAAQMPKTRRVTGIPSRGERQVGAEVDLRGMASDEAILQLDQYLDQALLSGRDTVTVIHGKGTGVLRNAVQAHLRSHKSVKGFRLGTFGEGENGVTIVQMKQCDD